MPQDLAMFPSYQVYSFKSWILEGARGESTRLMAGSGKHLDTQKHELRRFANVNSIIFYHITENENRMSRHW